MKQLADDIGAFIVLESIARQTIKIIDLILAGQKDGEIIKELNCERSLVNYYRKIIYEKNN